MKHNHTFTTSLKFGNFLAAGLLVLVPFHAFVTVSLSSVFGGYTALRLWSAVVLGLCMGILGYWLYNDAWLRAWFRVSLIVRLILLYLLLSAILAISAGARGDVTGQAAVYGLLINSRFLLFFVFVLALGQYSDWLRRKWPQLVLVPAMLVALFAILQYNVLPHNFLEHFGYGPDTIRPISTINNNPAYIRVQSTLRGPNPLGAYLVIIIGLLAAQWRSSKKRSNLAVYLAACSLALLFSFSRSAWLGAVAAVLAVLFVELRSRRNRLMLVGGFITLALIGLFSYWAAQGNTGLQNALFHTEDNSRVAVSSNDQRESALRVSLRDIIHHPLGTGPGTAGPASIHNIGHGVRLAENYYLQIAQEVGWFGMVLFVCICVAVGYRLWLRCPGALALGMLASFIGLAVVNMLSHAWADDTLAFIWWGLAGIATMPAMKKKVTTSSSKPPAVADPTRSSPHTKLPLKNKTPERTT